MAPAHYRARKILNVRLFDDEAGKRWQKSVKDQQYEILCVSQFTLYNRLKGNKPDFHLAMQGAEAANLYNSLLDQLKQQHSPDKIKGIFFFFEIHDYPWKSSMKCFMITMFVSIHFRWKIRCIDASSYPK